MVENCERAAPLIAKNIAAEINGTKKLKAYNPAFHGAVVSLGARYAVAELRFAGKVINMSGSLASLMKLMINVQYLFLAAGYTKA